MANAFLDFFIRENLTSQLKSAMDKDKNVNYHNTGISANYPFVNSFFDFATENLKLSYQEIGRKLNGSSEISSILYGVNKQNNSERENLITKFIPALESDANFFKSCLAVCLEEHLSNKINHLNNPPVYDHFLEKNQELFHNLVEIGIKSGHFSKLEAADFYTQNKEYQSYLQGKNLFKSNFNEENFIEILKNDKRGEDTTKFCASYIEEIIPFLTDNPEFFNKLKVIENSKPVLTLLCSTLINNNFDTDAQKYSRFLENVFVQPAVKNLILNQYISKHVLMFHPETIPAFIDGLTPEEKKNFYTIDNFSYLPSGYNTAASWLKIIANEVKTPNISGEVIEKLYRGLCEYLQPGNKKELTKFFSESVLGYTSTIGKNNPDLASSMIENYFKPIIAGFTLTNEGSKATLKNLKMLEEYLPSSLSQKLLEKCSQKVKAEVYYAFTNKDDWRSQRQHLLNNLPQFIVNHGRTDVLDVLNADSQKPLWKDLLVTSDCYDYNRKKNRSFSKYDVPFAFHIVDKTEGKAINWFLTPENVEHLAKIKYNDKSLLSYLNTSEFKVDVIKDIVSNPHACATLILSNKSALTSIKKIEDIEVQNALSYYKLDKQLAPSTDGVKVKRPKI